MNMTSEIEGPRFDKIPEESVAQVKAKPLRTSTVELAPGLFSLGGTHGVHKVYDVAQPEPATPAESQGNSS